MAKAPSKAAVTDTGEEPTMLLLDQVTFSLLIPANVAARRRSKLLAHYPEVAELVEADLRAVGRISGRVDWVAGGGPLAVEVTLADQ